VGNGHLCGSHRAGGCGAAGGQRVVEDGRLVTSRGAGTALEFGLALVRCLEGEAKADEVGNSIMA
jgi:transcriptional regulator GlxA family with amidase domain